MATSTGNARVDELLDAITVRSSRAPEKAAREQLPDVPLRDERVRARRPLREAVLMAIARVGGAIELAEQDSDALAVVAELRAAQVSLSCAMEATEQ